MTAKTIHLGYEVGTGEPVAVPLKHLAVMGQTQEAGKTTALEAAVSRSGCKAIAFVTKRGERSFEQARRIEPYFRERTDWQFVEAVLEAAMRQPLKKHRSFIIEVCGGKKTLTQVHQAVREKLPKARGFAQGIYTELDAYFDIVLPQLGRLPDTKKVDLRPGLNVMDLAAYSTELQALVIGSVLEWVLEREEDVVTVLPEAWEFVPESRGSPVKLAAEKIARKGATLKNYLWIDSQDMAGVAKVCLRGVAVWLIGVQREPNELGRNLKAIPEGIRKPKPRDVATLGLGEFFACWKDRTVKVYVQPTWMTDEDARAIARGEQSIELIARPAPPIDEEDPVSTKALEEKLDRLLDAFASRGLATQQAVDAATNNTPPPRPAAANSVPPAPAMAPDEDALYQRFKARLLAEAPQDLRVILSRPELQVEIKREPVTVDEHSGLGRMAKLIKEGFFNSPVSCRDVWVEMKRRGWLNKKANAVTAHDLCAKMDKKGFLTRDGEMYQAVPGMKVNLIES